MPMRQKEMSSKGLWASYRRWYRDLPKGRKAILIVFIVWAVQAIPKWTVAVVGDGEISAAIMKVFITPR